MTPATLSRIATAKAFAVLPAEELGRARRFYHDTLGFEVEDLPGGDQFMISAGEGTKVLVYQRARTVAEHTVAGFVVEDLAATMEEMRSLGIRFEEYDLPGLKTINGVVETPTGPAAWFTDTEGNIISVSQMA